MGIRKRNNVLEKYTTYSENQKIIWIDWPIPHNVEGIRSPKTFRKQGEPYTSTKINSLKEVKKFINWALFELRISSREFFGTCRRADLIRKKALIIYAVRCEFLISTKILGKLINRNCSQIPYLQMIAVRDYGEGLTEVGELIKKWREYNAEKKSRDYAIKSYQERKNLYLSEKKGSFVA